LATSSSYPTSHSFLILDNHSLIDISRAVLNRSVQAIRRSVDHRRINRGTDAASLYAIPFISVLAQEPQRSRLFTFGRNFARHLLNDNYNDNHHDRIVVISAITGKRTSSRARARAHVVRSPAPSRRRASRKPASPPAIVHPFPSAPVARPSFSSICGI